MRKHLAGIISSLTLSIAFVTLFSSTTSFLNPRYGSDSAIFRLIGSALANGKTLYLDIWDHKGPTLFVIQWLAQAIWPGRMGIYLLQIISLAVATWLLYVIARRFLAPLHAIVVQIAFFGMLAPVYENGNLTEEWTLPFVMFVLWGLTRSWQDGGKPPSWFILFASGTVVGFLFFMRLNNAAVALATFVAYFIYVLIRGSKFWLQLVTALAGFFAVCMGYVVVFAIHGSVQSMIYATFIYNFRYAGVDAADSVRGFQNGYVLAATALAGVAVLGGLVDAQLRRRPWYLVLALSLAVFGLGATLSGGNAYYHYLQILVPGAALGVALVLQLWTGKLQTIVAALVTAASLGIGVSFAGFTARQSDAAQEERFSSEVAEILQHVPEDERSEVFTWNLPSQYYLVADELPVHRFYTLQEWWGSHDPAIYKELSEFLASTPPDWIVTTARGPGVAPFAEIFASEYHRVATTQSLTLLKRVVAD